MNTTTGPEFFIGQIVKIHTFGPSDGRKGRIVQVAYGWNEDFNYKVQFDGSAGWYGGNRLMPA